MSPGSGSFRKIDLWPRRDPRARDPAREPNPRLRYAWTCVRARRFTERMRALFLPRAEQILAELAGGRAYPIAWDSLLARVLEQSELRGRSAETDRRYRVAARHFEDWASHRCPGALTDVRTLTRLDLERYIAWRRRAGVAWSTIRTEWSCLRVVLSRGVRDEILIRVPRPEVGWGAKQEEDRRSGRTPERGEGVLEIVPLILAAARAWEGSLPRGLPALIAFLAYTGCRIGEVLPRRHRGGEELGLRWKDTTILTAPEPVARIRGGKGRTRGDRIIPIPPAAAGPLRAHATGKVPADGFIWPYRSIGGAWRALRKDVGATLPEGALRAAAERLRVHDLRHHASHYWRARGVPDRHIDRLLGHRTPQVAAKYAAADVRELAESLREASTSGKDGEK